MFKKLATALVIASAVTTVQLPFSFDVQAAEAKQEKKKRPTQLVGPSVGKKVQKPLNYTVLTILMVHLFFC